VKQGEKRRCRANEGGGEKKPALYRGEGDVGAAIIRGGAELLKIALMNFEKGGGHRVEIGGEKSVWLASFISSGQRGKKQNL